MTTFLLVVILAILCYFISPVFKAVQCATYSALTVLLLDRLKPISTTPAAQSTVVLILLILCAVALVVYFVRHPPRPVS